MLTCSAEGPNPLKGDLFVILGSMLYACSNVTEVTSDFLGIICMLHNYSYDQLFLVGCKCTKRFSNSSH
jgi:hypothetical protein